MAFPTSVTTDGLNRGVIGPFVSSGGNVYVGTISDSAFNIRMFKATDPATSFANIGTDVVVGAATDELWSVAGFQVGDVIHVASKNGVAGGTTVDIRYHVFDMSSDTWTTSNTVVKSNMTLAGNNGLQGDIDICVRGDGAIFIIYNGDGELVSSVLYERVMYARNLAGSWTADFALGATGATESWRGGKALLGGANRVSFFFQNTSTSRIYERTLNTSNVLESLSAFASAPIGAFEAHEQRGIYLSATDVVHFPFQQALNRLDSINFTASDTAAIATDTDITGATNALGAPYKHVASFARHDSTVICAFLDSSNDIYINERSVGSWTTPVLHTTTSASAIYTMAFTRSSALVMGMVYLNSGDHFYNEYTLSVLGVAAILPARMTMLGAGI